MTDANSGTANNDISSTVQEPLKLYKSCKFADPLLTISTSLVHVTRAPVTCATVYMLLMSYCSSEFHCNAHLVLCSSSVSMRVGLCKPFQLGMRRQS